MKIRELIVELQTYTDLDDDIIVAWWTKLCAPCDVNEIPWSAQCDIIEENMDWSDAHEDMGFCIEYHYEDKDTEDE